MKKDKKILMALILISAIISNCLGQISLDKSHGGERDSSKHDGIYIFPKANSVVLKTQPTSESELSKSHLIIMDAVADLFISDILLTDYGLHYYSGKSTSDLEGGIGLLFGAECVFDLIMAEIHWNRSTKFESKTVTLKSSNGIGICYKF